jgi:hypothetical protein
MVAVGMPVSRHPPHRSQRALLTHWAPTLSMHDVKSLRRPWVKDSWRRKPPANEGPETFPRKPIDLTSSAQRAHPMPGDLFAEKV